MLGSGQVLSKFNVVPSPCPPGPYQLCGLWMLRCRKWRQWLSLGVTLGSHLRATLRTVTFTLEAEGTVKAWWYQRDTGAPGSTKSMH